MFPFSEYFDSAACKGLDVGGDIFGLNLDGRYLFIFEYFCDIHFSSTSNKNLDAARCLRGYYSSNEFKNAASLALGALVQRIDNDIYL